MLTLTIPALTRSRKRNACTGVDGVDRRGQAVAVPVGQLDGLVERLERRHADDRPERLGAVERVVRGARRRRSSGGRRARRRRRRSSPRGLSARDPAGAGGAVQGVVRLAPGRGAARSPPGTARRSSARTGRPRGSGRRSPRPRTAASKRRRNSSCTDAWTITVPSDVQRCPAVPNPENSAPSTARSRSASGITTSGFLPPSSRHGFCRWRPASSPIRTPDRRRAGEADLVDEPGVERGGQAVEGRGPVGEHGVQHAGGQPAAHEQLGERVRRWPGVYSAGFHTTALPHSSAGTRYQDGTATGKLPGRDDRGHPDRHAEGEQLLVRHLAGHGLPVEPPALAGEERSRCR